MCDILFLNGRAVRHDNPAFLGETTGRVFEQIEVLMMPLVKEFF
jgi:hypothetical protein